MPGQYYVYLPFKPTSAGTALLKNEVLQWGIRIQGHIDETRRLQEKLKVLLRDEKPGVREKW